MKIKALVASIALVSASASFAAPTQWTTGSGGNGHYYEWVSTSVNFSTAFTNAGAATYLGLDGYLVTITSAAENSFVSALAGGIFWMGGSDAVTEGTWKWLDGPEAGQTFTYFNWSAGEPNNLGNEDYLHGNWSAGGKWNDIYPTYTNGYVIEYSSTAVNPVPEPETYAMMLAGLGLMAGIVRRRRQRA